MSIEIAERIAKGNKAHYANAKLIKSKFLKKNTKMKIYKTTIRPVVTYSSQTWTLTAKDENNLRIFGRQILRKIFGPVNIDSVWRIRNNTEIDNLTLRRAMSYIYIYIYMEHPFLMFLDHTQRRSTVGRTPLDE